MRSVRDTHRLLDAWLVALSCAVVSACSVAHAAETFDGRRYYFGELHAHTGYSTDGQSADLGGGCGDQGCGNVVDYFRNAHQTSGLDFAALTDHVNGWGQMESDSWAEIVALVADGHAPDDGFLSLLGGELTVATVAFEGLGHKNFLFFGDQASYDGILLDDLRAPGSPDDCDALWAMVDALDQASGPLLMIPHHPATAAPMSTDWSCHDERLSPGVEVYSSHGNSWTTDEDLQYDPPQTGYDADGTVEQALMPQGWEYRLGVLGGTDHHDTWPGHTCHLGVWRDQSYGGSVSGVFLDDDTPFDRTTLYHAIRRRHSYATTGPLWPALLTVHDVDGAELGAMGDVIAPLPDLPLWARVTLPPEVEPYVDAVVLTTGDAERTPMESGGAGIWELEITQISPRWLGFAEVQIDGQAWYASQGQVCVDGGETAGERIWTSPLWIEPLDEVDDDGDGVSEADGDCDDLYDAIHPGADELLNGVDDDCDGAVDEGTAAEDRDGDGFSEIQGDCDDDDATVYPGADEVCDAIADNDCDGEPDPDEIDADADGVTPCDGDCDDTDPAVYASAAWACDGIADNDCDGEPDGDEIDADGDGISPCEGDCDDADASIHPGAYDRGNGVDDDCDGALDEDHVEVEDPPDPVPCDGCQCDGDSECVSSLLPLIVLPTLAGARVRRRLRR